VPEGYEPVNPPDNPEAIKFISRKFTPEEELENVAKSVKSYLDSFGEEEIKPTIAILVPRNTRGIEVIEALKKRNVEVIELISSTSTTRAAAGSLNYLLSYLADPQSARKLSKAYEVWRRDWREEVEKAEFVKVVSGLIQKIGQVENFIAPASSLPEGEGLGVREDWLATISQDEAEQVIEELKEFRVNFQRWLNAVTLPIDQLVLTLAQDVFTEASDLALAHKLALVLRKAADDHSEWRLPELTAELAVIAKNERRFIGFSEDDSGFDPERHRGKVVVTTMHRAKGLEWDRVYLMSVNNYDFPSGMPNDRFISEKWFIRQGLNMEAEALAQLTALESNSEYDWYEEGKATFASRLGYIKERLRLFYVGITRAKKDLIVTWNSGRQGDATPSLAMSELMGWWESEGSRQ
jgi:DNA helicase-2/ATP-dependent DNA helicase PcrA